MSTPSTNDDDNAASAPAPGTEDREQENCPGPSAEELLEEVNRITEEIETLEENIKASDGNQQMLSEMIATLEEQKWQKSEEMWAKMLEEERLEWSEEERREQKLEEELLDKIWDLEMEFENSVVLRQVVENVSRAGADRDKGGRRR